MSTYTQILYHIVYSTKGRQRTVTPGKKVDLFKYLHGVLANKQCHLYRINGTEDHIHLLTHIHPAISLSSMIKDMKISSSKFIKETQLFPKFSGWQDGYGAFTHSIKEKERLINYIKNQEKHHLKTSFKEEYIRLLEEHDIEFKEEYLF